MGCEAFTIFRQPFKEEAVPSPSGYYVGHVPEDPYIPVHVSILVGPAIDREDRLPD